MVIAVAVEKVSQAGVLTFLDAASSARRFRRGCKVAAFGVVYEGLACGAFMSCFRAGDSFDIVPGNAGRVSSGASLNPNLYKVLVSFLALACKLVVVLISSGYFGLL